ncbi:four helix bundle protein [Saccharicrinis sp. FJH62]|uniref:four helix bundle protein n=1 Tax=Saccharicrinis sp. FJH62 TaxID=3344657 RepID=UPI0035D43CD0
MKKNILRERTYEFSLLVIFTYQKILKDHKEYNLSKQFLRSGTAIGALCRESEYAQSLPDFISKLSISLKEANETDYWISLLSDTNYIEISDKEILTDKCRVIIRLLIASINTSKRKLTK